jgi:hypothetical protein
VPPTHDRDVVWISRDQIVARVREANWRLSTQTPRVDIYKLANSARRMDIPKKDFFPENAVRVILRSAGLTRDEIDDFLMKAIKKDPVGQ